jgi:hypothetical protein
MTSTQTIKPEIFTLAQLEYVYEIGICFSAEEGCKMLAKIADRFYNVEVIELKTKASEYEQSLMKKGFELMPASELKTAMNNNLEEKRILLNQLTTLVSSVKPNAKTSLIQDKLKIIDSEFDELKYNYEKQMKNARKFVNEIKPVFDSIKSLDKSVFHITVYSLAADCLYYLIQTCLFVFAFYFVVNLDNLTLDLDNSITNVRPINHHYVVLFIIFLIQVFLIDRFFFVPKS